MKRRVREEKVFQTIAESGFPLLSIFVQAKSGADCQDVLAGCSFFAQHTKEEES